MVKKMIKLFGVTLMGAVFFSFMPYSLYAYVAYISTGNVTDVTTTSAILNGSVNRGDLLVKAWFEYGAGTNLSNATFTNAYSFNSGYGGNYSTKISGLNPRTTYSFRAVAQNSEGRVYGNTYSFTTNFSNINNSVNYIFLTAITEPASFISSKSVQLNSLIYNEANEFSNVWFEWGTSPSNLNNKTTVVQTGILPTIRHADILTGLSPNTTYYFRAIAENSSFRNIGTVLSFSTKNTVATGGGASVKTEKAEKENGNGTKSLGSALGASVFGAGSFFPINLFGWLLLVVLVLVLITLGRHLQSQFSEQK